MKPPDDGRALTVAEWNRLQEDEAARAQRRVLQAPRDREILTVAEWNRSAAIGRHGRSRLAFENCETAEVPIEFLLSPEEMRALNGILRGTQEPPEEAAYLLDLVDATLQARAKSSRCFSTSDLGSLMVPISKPHSNAGSRVGAPAGANGRRAKHGNFTHPYLPPNTIIDPNLLAARTSSIKPKTISEMKRTNGRRVIPMWDAGPGYGYFDGVWGGIENRYRFFPKDYPFRCIGRIEIWDLRNGKFTMHGDNQTWGYNPGVGTLVGPRTVVTAAHCLPWDIDGQFAVRFIPAYYEGKDAAHWDWWFSGLGYFSTDHWTNSTDEQLSAWDSAILTLQFPAGNLFGTLGYGSFPDDLMDQPIFTHVGYPWALLTEAGEWHLNHPNLGPSDIPDSINGLNSPYAKEPAVQFNISFHDSDTDGDALELESNNADATKGDSGGPYFVWHDAGAGLLPYVMGVTSGLEECEAWCDDNVIAAAGHAFWSLINDHYL